MQIEHSARTMFARHKLGGTEDDIRWLVENDDRVYIAINWDNRTRWGKTIEAAVRHRGGLAV